MIFLELLFYLTVFVATIFVFDVIMNFASSLRSSRALAANRRTRMLADGASSSAVLNLLTQRAALPNSTAESGTQWVSARVSSLQPMIQRAGLNMTALRFASLVALAAVVLWALFWLAMRFPPITALVLGVVFAVIAGTVYLLSRINRRRARMTAQLPDVIDMIVRSLQAGHPIRAALGLVAKDVEDPLGSEFGIAVDEMTFGLELDAALENLRQRARVPDLDYMIVAINIQSRTGGNLAEILSNLATVIRDRYRVFKKVKALSAEGRLSASIIAVIPFVIALILGLNIHNYYQDAARNPYFPIIALVAVGLYALSLLAIWRIIKIRV